MYFNHTEYMVSDDQIRVISISIFSNISLCDFGYFNYKDTNRSSFQEELLLSILINILLLQYHIHLSFLQCRGQKLQDREPEAKRIKIPANVNSTEWQYYPMKKIM